MENGKVESAYIRKCLVRYQAYTAYQMESFKRLAELLHTRGEQMITDYHRLGRSQGFRTERLILIEKLRNADSLIMFQKRIDFAQEQIYEDLVKKAKKQQALLATYCKGVCFKTALLEANLPKVDVDPTIYNKVEYHELKSRIEEVVKNEMGKNVTKTP